MSVARPCHLEQGRSVQVDQQSRVISKREARRDAYVPLPEHGLSWASQNRRTLVVGSVVAFLLVIAVVAGALIYNARSEAASTAFGAAMADYQTPLAVPGQPAPPGVKTYASVTERAKAANQRFLQVASKYSLTPDGKNARYFAGLTYLEAGENSSAESTLKDVASSWNSNLANLAKLALAQLYRQTGRDAQAIDLYNQLTAKPSNTVPSGLAQLQLADLYTGENKPDAARRIYAQLKDKDAKGPAGVMAAQKLNPTAAATPQIPQ